MNNQTKKFARLSTAALLSALGVVSTTSALPSGDSESIRTAFKAQSIELGNEQISTIRESLQTAVQNHCNAGPTGANSKVRFAAVDISQRLGLNAKTDGTIVPRIEKAITSMPCSYRGCDVDSEERCIIPIAADLNWSKYYDQTIGLNSNRGFLSLLEEKKFFPVKISWEDIGRYQNSVWGDRISDVGIWVRKEESDSSSAQLALSVRRDSNFRDKVLVVPSEKIKIHLQKNGDTREVTLPERLKELGLTSESRDEQVIVSNQFAIVPVPAAGSRRDADHPPRAAFNFSIYPYGSTNYVITDVIEGSSDAIVGPGSHQLLFANIDGEKAPFTASRAKERKDLLELESRLKSQGMDVDVQRYYLIQIPLKKGKDITLANMGTPPMYRAYSNIGILSDSAGAPAPMAGAAMEAPAPAKMKSEDAEAKRSRQEPGLEKVAIGHGEVEGDYSVGSGFRGNRAEEPIRVTVVYFVTPVGEVTRADMETFTKAFESWDNQALWGGSFVTPSES